MNNEIWEVEFNIKYINLNTGRYIIMSTVQTEEKNTWQFKSLLIFIYLLMSSFSRRVYPKRLTNEDIIEAIKTNKRATTCKCYYKSWLA